MHRWYQEDWQFTMTVLQVDDNNSKKCRLGFEPGDRFVSTYECPANICPLIMMLAFPIMAAVRSGGNLQTLGGAAPNQIEFTCPDGVVRLLFEAEQINNH